MATVVVMTNDEKDRIKENVEAVLDRLVDAREHAGVVLDEIFELGLLNDFGLSALTVLQDMESLDTELRVKLRDLTKPSYQQAKPATAINPAPKPAVAAAPVSKPATAVVNGK